MFLIWKEVMNLELTPRVRQILMVLLNQSEIMPVKVLAEQINTSKRTVQRELDYINYILKNYHMQLCSKTGSGIWLEGEAENKETLLAMLENRDEKDYADKVERRKSLQLELLRDQTPKKLYYYANLFSVSEATISKDMELIEPWFERFELKIYRKPGYGVALQGSEKNLRTAIHEFISKNMGAPVLNQLYGDGSISTPKAVGVNSIKNRYQLLDENILRQVSICFASIPDDRIRYLTEESYIGLILHVAIAIERVQGGEFIESNPQLLEKFKRDEEYNLALLIVNSLEKEFSLEIPDIEIAFIGMHIKASKSQRAQGSVNSEDVSFQEQQDLDTLVQEMLVAYDEQLAHMFSADEDFVAGLKAHMRPTFVRLRNNLPIENPHLQEIKKSYQEVYGRCKRVAQFLTATTGFTIPEDEIGFLAIHFGAALVRLEDDKESKRVVQVGLVCASGIGISRLMASRVKKYLKARVQLTTYGKSDLTPFVQDKNDFFISSMDLPPMDATVIQVSPLLPEEDLLRIEEEVRRFELTPNRKESNTDFEKKMEQINELARRIKEILRNFKCIPVDANTNFQNLVQTAAAGITSYEPVRLQIIDNLKRREEIATQIVPELEIALLHGRIADLFEVGFYVCVPEGDSLFHHPYLQSTKAGVIMLVPEDEQKQENSQLFGFLSESLIEEPDFLNNIKTGDPVRIKAYLSRLLKQYFNMYIDRI